MNLTDLIDKAKELIGGGGIDTLTEDAGQLSDIAQGEGSVTEKAQQAVEELGGSGEGGAGSGGGSQQG